MNECYFCIVLLFFVRVEGEVNGEPCQLDKGSQGICVPLSACAPYVSALKGGNLEDGLRLMRERSCGLAHNEAKVCCIDSIEEESNLDSRIAYQDEDDYVDAFPEPPDCGKESNGSPRSHDCQEKIFFGFGKPTPKGPGISRWMARLYYKNAGVPWACGGSIITARHVLTAAHCVKDNLYLVRVGQIDYSPTPRYPDSPADYLIKKAIRHPNYTKYQNDIAVLVLQEDIEYNKYVGPICLPLPKPSYQKIEVGVDDHDSNKEKVLIEGWGGTETGQWSNLLLYTYVNRLDRSHCRDVYKTHKDKVTIDERVLCAGAQNADACNGDSGSPLLGRYCTQGKDEQADFPRDWYYQLGIVSFGYKCNASRFAGVYTNVEHYMPWIQEMVLGR